MVSLFHDKYIIQAYNIVFQVKTATKTYFVRNLDSNILVKKNFTFYFPKIY
jgi:hypothetical protein